METPPQPEEPLISTQAEVASSQIEDLSMEMGYVSVTDKPEIPASNDALIDTNTVDDLVGLGSTASEVPAAAPQTQSADVDLLGLNVETPAALAETSNESLVTIEPLAPAPVAAAPASEPELLVPEKQDTPPNIETTEEIKIERKDSIVRFLFVNPSSSNEVLKGIHLHLDILVYLN